MSATGRHRLGDRHLAVIGAVTLPPAVFEPRTEQFPAVPTIPGSLLGPSNPFADRLLDGLEVALIVTLIIVLLVW